MYEFAFHTDFHSSFSALALVSSGRFVQCIACSSSLWLLLDIGWKFFMKVVAFFLLYFYVCGFSNSSLMIPICLGQWRWYSDCERFWCCLVDWRAWWSGIYLAKDTSVELTNKPNHVYVKKNFWRLDWKTEIFSVWIVGGARLIFIPNYLGILCVIRCDGKQINCSV